MKNWIDEFWENEALPALMEFGKIPNVSPAFSPKWSEEGHMDRAATYLKEWAESRQIMGMTVELLRSDMRTPLIFIEVAGEKDETVLIYGHLDKQPPMLPWRDGLDPWVPVREGDLVYGRGLADDGYSIFAALGAVEAAQNSGAKLPRICVLIEASEESSSPDLRHYISLLKERIGNPSVVITLDSEDRDGDRLWLTQSLRGVVNGFLTIETMRGTMHSGLASGVVPSTTRILRMLLSRIENQDTGHVLNEILSPPLTNEFRTYVDTIARDATGYIESYELPEGLQVTADSLPELVANNLVRAALEVTGITGLPEAEKAGNVMVGRLTARLSLRIPPSVDPDTVALELKRVFETDPPYNATVTFELREHGWGWRAKPYSIKIQNRLLAATQECFGTDPGLLGVGASISFVQIMVNEFPDAEHVLTGILSHSSHAHGPNENMSVRKVKRLTHFVATFLAGE